tara:strand:+ start:1309 stop:1665 length:357 start_codon:yes stop_codon:yes gene_type:complete
MDIIPRFIKDRGYDIEDDFLITLQEMDKDIALKIAVYIEDNIRNIKPNNITTYVLGGVIHHNKKPITFALELLKLKGTYITLTDLTLIDMNEYLDLICLNSYIKPSTISKNAISNYKI